MRLDISAWSIRNPTPAILLFILLATTGLLALRAIKIQNFPDIDFPMVNVIATLPGASPAQLETDVVRKIENSLATLQGVKHIQSTLTRGSAKLTVEFRLETPTQQAVDDVRDAVARVRGDLPAALRDPVIKRVELADSSILTYTISAVRLDDEALSWLIDDDISRTLLGVPGVGAVTRIGGVTREIRINLDPARLLALNATAADISRRLRDMQQDAAGGRTDAGGVELSVRIIATVQTAAELGELEVTLSDGRRLRLDQVASIEDTVAEPRSLALLNGAPVVGFEVVRARGAGEIEVAAGVRAALEKLRAEHPEITITEVLNFVDPVVENFNGSIWLLFEGAVLSVLVVWLFLRDWRATCISAVALPLSVIPTFAVMYALDFSFNVVTLLSLSLVIGILVDDAIVEVENIQRHLLLGKTPYQASMEAADEIGLAVIATTFTLIAVFLPTAFMQGTVGKFFKQFGWTAATAVFFSLVVARMLTPMMSAYLLHAKPPRSHPEPRWVLVYLVWARWCLLHRRSVAACAAAFFGAGLVLANALPGTFMPPDDDSYTQVTLTLPPGSMLRDTLTYAERARRVLERNAHVKTIFTTVGHASNGDAGPPNAASVSVGNVSTAVLTIQLTHRTTRPGLHKHQIEAQMREALAVLPGVRVMVGMGGGRDNYVLVLASDEGRVLAQHALEVERELRTIPGIGAVTSTASLTQPELTVRPDFARAADLGVTSAALAETLRIATVGDYDQEVAKLNLSERQVSVLVRLTDAARDDLATLKRLPVPGARGPVALENVADLKIGSGPTEIARFDRQRNVNFELELNGQDLGVVAQAARALPSLQKLPPSVMQTTNGDAEELGELTSGFALAMLTGVLCIYVVLVLLLRGFVQPVTILVALVLAIPGASFALFVTGSALSMPSLIGLIMLMGIASKNSILLVDYIIIARRDFGLNRWDASLDACRKRVRPIVMTTIAMGLGMLPIALGLGADPSFRAPLAIVVIGGLITSTFLSLLVVPVVYSYIDDAAQWLVRRVRCTP